MHVASGVGVGVFVAVQEHPVSHVQFGLRHILPEQTSPDTQSVFKEQLSLQVASGVGVGVYVGVFVGVFAGVVGVGVARLNVSVHAGSAALGVTCGTVGATGFVFISLPLVRRAMAPILNVIRVIVIKYQYFFRNFIRLLNFYGKAG